MWLNIDSSLLDSECGNAALLIPIPDPGVVDSMQLALCLRQIADVAEVQSRQERMT